MNNVRGDNKENVNPQSNQSRKGGTGAFENIKIGNPGGVKPLRRTQRCYNGEELFKGVLTRSGAQMNIFEKK